MARNFIKLKKYPSAKRVLEDILSIDELNLYAKKLLVEVRDIELKGKEIVPEDVLDLFDYNFLIKIQLDEINEIGLLDEEGLFKDFFQEYTSRYQEISNNVKEVTNLKNELLDKCNKYCNYNYKNLIKLLKALGYSEKEYNKNFGMPNYIVYWNEGWIRDGHALFCPKIISISTNSIYIRHDLKRANNKDVENADLVKHDSYTFKKENKLSLMEQIKIVDLLLEGKKTDNKSIFSKLFKH